MRKNINLTCIIIILSAIMAACMPFDDKKSEGSKHLFDFDSLFGSNNTGELYETDGNYEGIDDVQINEFTKDGKLVRMFCDKKTGRIKLKMGSENESVKNLNSPEEIKQALKMPESDYIHLGGGVTDMVTTIGTGKKGHSMILNGVGIYVKGSEDTEADLAKLENIDFIYSPCSYKLADDDKDSTENVDDMIEEPQRNNERLKRYLQILQENDEKEENVYGWQELELIAPVTVDEEAAERSDDARIDQINNREVNPHHQKGGMLMGGSNSKKHKKRSVDPGVSMNDYRHRPKDTDVDLGFRK